MKNKISNMTVKDWISTSLWILSLVLLFAFVIVAAVADKDNKTTYANMLAGTGFAFGISLFSALITTVAFAYFKKKEATYND